ncbi:tRNA pseudouridine synthase A-like, partial [Ylistrum balloti]|uniref:tRNA pseudouridine synthase A-like n=1 Tax=Ylistrum balloti TaxID=509963 RepID=UPI002905B4C8
MNILLCISYEGTPYHGFQVQSAVPTVQETIEQALKNIYAKRIHITGAARTDSGVHAERSYVNFFVDETKIPPRKLAYVLNTILPSTVLVLYSKQVPDGFHA